MLGVLGMKLAITGEILFWQLLPQIHRCNNGLGLEAWSGIMV